MVAVTAMISGILSIPIAARLSEAFKPSQSVPLIFAARAILSFSIQYIDNPNSNVCRLAFSLLIIVNVALYVSLQAWYTRNMPKRIRGLMTQTLEFAKLVGAILFITGSGYAFDYIGPASPFTILSIADACIVLLLVTLVCAGILK